MNATTYLLTICIAGIATYLTRFPGLLLGRNLKAAPRIEQGLKYIPIGIFAAMDAPTIFLHPAFLQGHVDYPFFTAALIAIIVAWRTKNPLWTMLVGVVVIAVLRSLG